MVVSYSTPTTTSALRSARCLVNCYRLYTQDNQKVSGEPRPGSLLRNAPRIVLGSMLEPNSKRSVAVRRSRAKREYRLYFHLGYSRFQFAITSWVELSYCEA